VGGTTSSPTMLSVTDRSVDEKLVGISPGFEHGVAAAINGQLLGIESAFRANRYDHRILDLLRLDQAEHLGAVILRPVGPAQAAARNRTETQMHAFNLCAIDEHLAERPWFGQSVERLRVELESKSGTWCTVCTCLEKLVLSDACMAFM
jgi:hypothetical protein